MYPVKNVAAGTSAEAVTTYQLTITFTAEDGYVIDTAEHGTIDVTGTGGDTVALGGTPTAESVTVVVFYPKTSA